MSKLIKLSKIQAGVTLLIITVTAIVSCSVLAVSSPWTQSDWSAGGGQQNWTNSSEYDSSSGVDTTTANQVTLTDPQKFTNPNFETDLSGWNGGINPGSISGMQLWLKADSLTGLSNGDPVSSWADSSGNDNNAVQSDSSRDPTYVTNAINGEPALQFNGTNQGLYVPTAPGLNAVNGFAIFIVAKDTVSGSNQVLVYKGTLDNGNNYNYRIIEWPDGNQYGGLGSPSGEIFYPFGSSDAGNYQLLSSYWDGSNLYAYVDGQQAGSASAAVTGQTYSNDLQIGYSDVDNSDFLNGDIAEIIIYNSVITNTQRQEVEAYLQAKYGISSGYGTVSRDTSTTYNGDSGSAKIVVTTNPTNFIQTVNVGNTDIYNLSADVYTDGSPVTSSDAQLYYNGSTISTTYTDEGSGWYQLNGTVTGADASEDYGVQIEPNTTAYIDNASLEDTTPPSGTLTSSIFDSGMGSGADWGNLTYDATTPADTSVEVKVRTGTQPDLSDAPDFSSCNPITSGTSASSNSCVTDGDRYAQYQLTLGTSDNSVLPVFSNFSLDYTSYSPPASSTPASSGVSSSTGSTGTITIVSKKQSATSTLTSTPTSTTPSSYSSSTTGKSSPAIKSDIMGKDYNLVVKITQNGKPLVGAQVTLHSTPIVVTTGSDGIARFYGVEGGDHHVLVAYHGYASRAEAVTLVGSKTDVAITLTVQFNPNAKSFFSTYAIIVIVILTFIICFLIFLLAKRRKKQKMKKGAKSTAH